MHLCGSVCGFTLSAGHSCFFFTDCGRSCGRMRYAFVRKFLRVNLSAVTLVLSLRTAGGLAGVCGLHLCGSVCGFPYRRVTLVLSLRTAGKPLNELSPLSWERGRFVYALGLCGDKNERHTLSLCEPPAVFVLLACFAYRTRFAFLLLFVMHFGFALR